MEKEITILDIFDIKGNDDRKQWEFTPKVDGYTSYTVHYSEAQSKSDAIIAVYKSIKAMQERSINPQTP